MYKIRNLANTIDQFKILQHLDIYHDKLVKNLIAVELINNNTVKIKDKHNDECYLFLEDNVLRILDEKNCFCWEERID